MAVVVVVVVVVVAVAFAVAFVVAAAATSALAVFAQQEGCKIGLRCDCGRSRPLHGSTLLKKLQR